MKAKVLFLMLFCILFVGCSKDDDSAPSYIGCWHTIAQENNGKWDTDMRKTYKIKFVRTEDNFDFDFIRDQLENPTSYYPNQ